MAESDEGAVPFESVPTYREEERRGHRRRTTRTSYHVPKSRRKFWAARRAPVRDSQQAYRVKVIRTHDLHELKQLVKGGVYTVPLYACVPKSAKERAADTEDFDDAVEIVDIGNTVEAAETVEGAAIVEDVAIIEAVETVAAAGTVATAETVATADTASTVETTEAADTAEAAETADATKAVGTPNAAESAASMAAGTGKTARAVKNVTAVRAPRADETGVTATEAVGSTACGQATVAVDDTQFMRPAKVAKRAHLHAIDLTGFEYGDSDRGEEVAKNKTENVGEDEMKSDDTGDAWPEGVFRLMRMKNVQRVKLPDKGAVDWCGCREGCRTDRCVNALSDIYCASNNCLRGATCGNRPVELQSLFLRRTSAEGGLGVFSRQFISSTTVIGEYAGLLSDHNYANDKNRRRSDYTMELTTRSTTDKTLFIEAHDYGSMARFINHSCDANCGFFEVQNRRKVAVLVIAIEDIAPGQQITVDYGDSLWFQCKCGARQCRSL